MKNSLYNVLLNSAVENIKTIIDPVEKVKAIASVLPFIDKTEMVEDVAPNVLTITKEVEKKVEENIVKFEEQEKVQKETVSEEHVEAPKEEASVQNDVSKFDNMTLKEYFEGEDNSLMDKFTIISELKGKMKEFFEQNMPGRPGLEDATLNYYMCMVDPENEKVQEDKMNMTIKVYLEKFVPFAQDLLKIYGYKADKIKDTLQTMSNNIYKEGIANVNCDNAGALVSALEDVA